MIKSPSSKISKHTAHGYPLFTLWSIVTTKSKHDYDRCKDCMKNFCKGLGEHLIKCA